MYYYIYDIFLSDKKYEKQLERIEIQLRNFGIQGKVYKLNVLKNIGDIVDEAVANGVKNIIAVGNDQTVSKIAASIINKKVVLGIIPVGEPNNIANLLGIPEGVDACKVLSARKVSKLDVGKVNTQYFLLSVEPPNNNVIFDFGSYQLTPRSSNSAHALYNLNIDSKNYKSRPDDGIMEIVFTPKQISKVFKFFGRKDQEEKGLSVFPVKEFAIEHKKKPVSVTIDRYRVLKTPLNIKTLPQKLEVIVGRERIFD